MSRRTAFTLVELLVVMGIISVLIAILLPAMSKAREQAKSVQCLSNLRQIGLGILQYAGDYQYRIPQDISYRTPSDGRWWYEFYDGSYGYRDYLPARSVYACPKMEPASRSYYGMYHAHVFAPKYAFTAVSDGWASFRGIQLSAVPQPADFALIFDTAKVLDGYATMGAADWFSDRAYQGTETRAVWMAHPSGANALFADGHAETCDAGRLKSVSNHNELGSAVAKRGISVWKDQNLRVVSVSLP